MATKATLQIVPLAETKPLAELEAAFSAFVGAVETMLDPEAEKGELDHALVASIAGNALSAPEKIDDIVALLNAREFQELLLRKAVQAAEARARHHAAFVDSMKSSIQLYMQEKGIAKIEGFAHFLAVYKKPDRLTVDNEDLVPDEFFDVQMVEQKTLNKDRLLAALQTREVPGATLHRDQRRLGVK